MEKFKPTEGAAAENAGPAVEKVGDRKEAALESYARNVGTRAQRALVEAYKNKADGRALAFSELSKILHEHDPSVPIVEMAPDASPDEVTQQAEALGAEVTRTIRESGIDVTNNNNGQPYPEIINQLHHFDEGPWGMITGSLMTSERLEAIREYDRNKVPGKNTGDESRYPGFGKGGF